ncbi:hypothetical protein PHSC3_001566 [Chlamydiales bacterium STE3]|nr:hypothetical protein PHSC3_001566 [Chlamydiales bacterium STE3]
MVDYVRISLWQNPVIEKVMLFLLVNEKCYPAQLKNTFQSPLYNFQRAFARLEKGGISVSQSERKKLIYQFNLRYPL